MDRPESGNIRVSDISHIKSIIREVLDIIELDMLPKPLRHVEGIRSYLWHIATKYYEADVHVCAMDERTLANKEFAELVNAVVLYFDSTDSENGISNMEQWHTFTKEFDAEVRILICDRCDDAPGFPSTDLPVSGSGVKKTDALAWCIANGFELVELNPAEPEESEFEDDFPESLGMKRVVEALKAHLWPNLTLLDAPGRMSSSLKKRLIDARDTNNTKECEENSSAAFVTKSHVDIIDQMLKVDLPGAMGNPTDSHASEDSFEALFENLSAMKSKANNLPPSERKEYAKDMAFAFWRAIGGNESEIEDIVSDDDEPSIGDEN